MQQDVYPTLSDTEQQAQPLRHDYLLYGTVHETTGQPAHLDSDLLGKLLQRRLKRLERVLGAHGGLLVKSFPRGLVAGFDSAEAALIGACEMQRRCAVIPQLADTQLSLKIGIHASIKQHLTRHAIDPAEATAAKLSALLGQAGIVLSEQVMENLPDDLKKTSTPIANDGSAIAAFAVDWNAVPARPLPRPVALEDGAAARHSPPAGSSIVLRQGDRTFVFDNRQHVIAIGRDMACDLPINSAKVSRKHARIIYRLGNYVLIDMSTNGTYLYPDGGSASRIQKNMIVLSGKGRIGFGLTWEAGSPHSFEFELKRPD
ncbi:FHA domain-containing protein [uncultured Dechloromonas sp.]|uniref:FHA domain-containing protein n=1 Tax=uncultured Dechloromonas sp. TaxID=171719 RepID=UPI0025E032C1|nr:FHA domain-containing protein [uncultured Dechloromonas sp.]